MFCFTLRGEVDRKDAVNLVTGRLVPILVIDAGGGLAVQGSPVTFEQVTSVPYRAFLGGMMSIPWPKARPLDVKGFISVIGVTSTTPQAEDQLRKISFALLSREYMNFSLCLGYHASTIEAYLGNNLDSNYIRFHYEGGAASIDRRLRRLQLIGEILTHIGFRVTVTGDLLDGLIAGDPETKLLKTLEILGRLEVYTKQMDMVMSDDAAVSSYVAGFLEKHC
jgi:pyruvate,water dikinase